MKIKSSQWLIRSSKGKIQGPISTREVMFKIKSGELDGSESISSYPGGSWRPISHNSDFYDYLLTSLSHINEIDDDETDWDIDTATLESQSTEKSGEASLPSSRPKETDFSKKENLPTSKKSTDETKENNSDLLTIIDEKKPQDSKKPSSGAEEKKRRKNKGKKKKSKHKKNKQKIAKKTQNNLLRKVLTASVVVLCLCYFLLGPESKKEDYVKLLVPTKEIKMEPEEVKKIADRGMKFFLQDTTDGYIEAQKEFTRVLNADPTYNDFYSLMCVIYYRLWPFTDQSPETLKTITKFTQIAKQYDSTKLNYANCNSAYLLINQDMEKASAYLDSIIYKFQGSSNPPTIPYFFKSEILLAQKNYVGASEQINLLEQLWPTWLATPYLAGVAYFHLQDVEPAIARFKVLLKEDPNNKKALIYVGLMREAFYQQYQKAIDSIEAALELKGKITDNLRAKAYFHLARSYLKLDNGSRAKKYAKLSYQLDPVNIEVESLYVSFYGDKDNIVLSDKSYIAQGDQFRRDGDCNAAQAYYKEAIKVNPKNANAALKSALCLWSLGLSQDALDILLKSLQVNPKSVDVAVQLAAYYRQLYKFNSAQEVLNKTHKVLNGHHDIYREFAELEIARNNPISVIKYADKALEKYSLDIKALVVKSKALLMMKKYQEAYSISSKALEIESSNVEAQVVFSKVYFYVHGVDATVKYLNKLISLYATEKEYRYALGEIYLLDEQYPAAEKVFRQLVEIDNKYKSGLMGLATCYKKQGDLTKSQQTFFKAASLDPSDAEPLVEVGLIYLESRNYSRALKQFKRVININPDFPKISYFMGKTHSLMKNYKEAIKWANQEKVSNPQEVDAYLLAGEIYEAQGLYQFCSREYQQAIQFRDFGAYVYLQISRCYSKSGALDVAVTMLEKARSKQANLPDIYRELGAIYELKGNRAKALWAYEYYTSLAPNASDIGQITNKIERLQ